MRHESSLRYPSFDFEYIVLISYIVHLCGSSQLLTRLTQNKDILYNVSIFSREILIMIDKILAALFDDIIA